MACELSALGFGANDPDRLARFWGKILGREVAEDPSGRVALPPTDATGFRIRFLSVPEPKTAPNQMHFDLTSTTLEEQEQTVARALELGGRHIDIGQDPADDHVVLADPEGNEFCVIPPGNNFLAGCGTLGALSSDGTQAVGYFWSTALGWPLVWDQDEETAIQSTSGGSKISWGGPPVRTKRGRNRLHLDLSPVGAAEQAAEVERLVSLGATRADAGECEPGWVAMTDPDGNEFCLSAPGLPRELPG